MKKRLVVLVFAILVSVSIAAGLGNNLWGYAQYDAASGVMSYDVGLETTHEFEDFIGLVPEYGVTMMPSGIHDYYRVFMYTEQPKEIVFPTSCCACSHRFNGNDLPGEPAGLRMFLEKGWNKLEIDQIGDDPPSFKGSPWCNGELTATERKLGSLVDGVSSYPFGCDPADECCKGDGSGFEEVSTLCNNEEGRCDEKGLCINADESEEICTELYGPNAYVNRGSNKCCGDDPADCGAYNSGFFCRGVGGSNSEWVPVTPNLGRVFSMGCMGASVVIDQGGVQKCFVNEPPLNYEFTYFVEASAGNNMWKYSRDFQLQPEIPDKNFLDTSFGAGTFTRINTFIHMEDAKAEKIEFECVGAGFASIDTDVTINVSVIDENKVQKDYPLLSNHATTAKSDKVEATIEFPAGTSELIIECKSKGTTGGERHLRINPAISTIVDAMGSQRPKGGLMQKQELSHKLLLKEESLGKVQDFLPGFAPPQTDPGFDPEDLFGGGEIPEESFEVPTFDQLFFRSDGEVEFIYTRGTENPATGNPIRTNNTGLLRVVFVGDPPPPPTGELTKKQIGQNSYACVRNKEDPQTKVVAECVRQTGSHVGGGPSQQAVIGDAHMVFNRNNDEYELNWCGGRDGHWVSELDNREDGDITCEAAKSLDGLPLNYQFTGTKCCGDDKGEYYNDPFLPEYDQHGGCLNGYHVDFGDFPYQSNPTTANTGQLTNHLGMFQACGISSADTLSVPGADEVGGTVEPDDPKLPILNLPPSDPPTLSLNQLDTYAAQPLVNFNPVCTVLENARGDKDFFCSPSNNWEVAGDSRQRILKNDESTGATGCCPVDSCWDGTQCIENQANDPQFRLHNGKRCLGGSLTVAEPKFRFDLGIIGFCPEESQCLVNVDGSMENNNKPETFFLGTPAAGPVCIGSGQHIMEFHCADGDWTSRTKLIALQLESLAKSKGSGYTIFCDEYEEVLNFFAYRPTETTGTVTEYLESVNCKNGRCVNQFCGMSYSDGIAFGTSLNEDVDHPTKSFLYTLGLQPDACEGAKNNNGQYNQCADKVYYNHDSKSVVFLPSGSLPSDTISTLYTKDDSIKGSFEELAQEAEQRLNTTFFGESKLFSQLFIENRGGREYFGFVAKDIFDQGIQLRRSYVGANFNTIDAVDPSGRDPCDLIRSVDPGFTGFCEFNDQSKSMKMIRYSIAEQDNPTLNNWRDFTSKFRSS